MSAPLRSVFTACGIELEYMIVDRETLDVRPIADQVLRASDGLPVNDIERGDYGWSNELVAHVLEIKNDNPDLPVAALVAGFAAEIGEVNRRLEPLGAQLMPSAMHPWMDPKRETRLWPHEYADIYRSYDRIFDCRRHGWANLQSMHVNLPFAGDAEFVRLHEAIRLVLPLLPALAASSPLAEGRRASALDFRMVCYRTNSARMPSMTGELVPESVSGRSDYQSRILAPIHRDIRPLDPEGVMDGEWLNARGAIARFDRDAIEIRVIDTQERPRADLAIAAATIAVVRACYEGTLAASAEPAPLPPARLAMILDDCAREGEAALISDAGFLACFGVAGPCRAGDVWRQLLERTLYADAGSRALWSEPLELILRHGTLARRILTALGSSTDHGRIEAVYRRLCECLARDEPFIGES